MKSIFSEDFFPTPTATMERMIQGEQIEGKTILEPSCGSGTIVTFLQSHGANVIGCENHPELRKIAQTKCNLIGEDFLKLESSQVSHIDAIYMNPPFSNGDAHILHAYSIAPPGCRIIALCNLNTIEKAYTKSRQELNALIEANGSYENLGSCFDKSERKTGVEVALIRLQKAGENYNAEFEGFFLEEEEELQANGIMPYNVVRDLVNRYVAAVKLYDEQLNVGVKMNSLLSGFYGSGLGFSITEDGKPKARNDFKKDLQKAGWNFIFDKLNMQKYSTRGLKEDINKFVEQQAQIPFTMRNIYRMLEIVVGTQEQRMDKAILEAFDRVTEHHAENRFYKKGWKTNSHYFVGKKFILPNIISPAKEYGFTSDYYTSMKNSWDGTIPDLEKALCFVMGEPYETITKENGEEKRYYIRTVNSTISRNIYGEWYSSQFFRYKGYKNGNMHFEFISEDVWAAFNSRVAKLRGYPLPESKVTSHKEKKQRQRQDAETAKHSLIE